MRKPGETQNTDDSLDNIRLQEKAAILLKCFQKFT